MIRVAASKSKGKIWLEQYRDQVHLVTSEFDYTKAGKVAQKIFQHQGIYWGNFPEKLSKEEVSTLIEKINRAYRGIYSYHEAILSVDPDYVETADLWVIKISNVHGKLSILSTDEVEKFISLVRHKKSFLFSDRSTVTLDSEQTSDLIERVESARRAIIQMNRPATSAEQNCRETVYDFSETVYG